MNTKLLKYLTGVVLILALLSCKSNPDLSKYEVEQVKVHATYEEKVAIEYNTKYKLDDINFYDSTKRNEIVSKLVPGDKLNIYHKDSKADYVFVEKANILHIEVNLSETPGEKRLEMFTNIDGLVIDHSNISYFINEDFSYVSINDFSINVTYYGTYDPNNNIKTTDFTTLIKLESIYSYPPR